MLSVVSASPCLRRMEQRIKGPCTRRKDNPGKAGFCRGRSGWFSPAKSQLNAAYSCSGLVFALGEIKHAGNEAKGNASTCSGQLCWGTLASGCPKASSVKKVAACICRRKLRGGLRKPRGTRADLWEVPRNQTVGS